MRVPGPMQVTSVSVDMESKGPKVLTEPVPKMEREEQEKAKQLQQGGGSFMQKYWYYIIAGLLLMSALGGGEEPKGGGEAAVAGAEDWERSSARLCKCFYGALAHQYSTHYYGKLHYT